jgi:hypothetical protein
MGGSHREAAKAVVLGREPERRRGLWWREPVRWTLRRWRRGEELDLGRGRPVKRGSGWWSTAFQAPRWCGAVRGKGGGPYGRDYVAEGEGEEPPRRDDRQCGAASNDPRLSGVGGGAVRQ